MTLCNSSNTVITTTTTNASGAYTFSNLVAGGYIVKFPTTVNGKPLTTSNNLVENLSAGQNITNQNAGYYQTSGQTGSISGVAYNDDNNNGVKDGTEAPISNVTVTLCNSSNTVITTTTTNASGVYTFSNVAAGSYIVKFPTTANGKPLSTPNNLVENLVAGQNITNQNAGYYQATTIDCNNIVGNTITKSCVNGIPALTGPAMTGFEYQWMAATGACPTQPSQAIVGATGQNYTLPAAVSVPTFFRRCARPIGCTTWSLATESNCITVLPTDCNNAPVTNCDGLIVTGTNAGTITISGAGNNGYSVQIFDTQWRDVFSQFYNTPTASIPLKNGSYIVKVQLYNTSTGNWQFICEKAVQGVTVSGALYAVVNNSVVLELGAAAELHKVKLAWANNTGYQNDYFEVEKLNSNTGSFEKIAIVNSMNGNKTEYYTAYDENPVDGDNTYRINLTTTDGTKKVSNQSTVKFYKSPDIRLFPNPTSDYIDVDLKQYVGQSATISIYNNLGHLIMTKEIEKTSETPVHIDLDTQANGQYMLQVTSKDRKSVYKKFTIQH